MNGVSHRLVSTIFLLGFTAPLVYLSVETGYANLLLQILRSPLTSDINLLTLAMGLLLVFWQGLGWRFKGNKIYESIGLYLLMGFPCLPSLVFLVGALSGNEQFFILAEDFYLSWIAIGATILPLLVVARQFNTIMHINADVAGPVLGTIGGYACIAFLGVVQITATSTHDQLSGLALLGINVFYGFVRLLASTVSSILGFGMPGANFFELLTGFAEYPSWIQATFLITTAAFFFFRLGSVAEVPEKKNGKMEVSLAEKTWITMRRLGLSVLLTVTLTGLLFITISRFFIVVDLLSILSLLFLILLLILWVSLRTPKEVMIA